MLKRDWSPMVGMWYGDQHLFAINKKNELDVIDVSKGLFRSMGRVTLSAGIVDLKTLGSKAFIIHQDNYFTQTLSVIDFAGLTPVLSSLTGLSGKLQFFKDDVLFESANNVVITYRILRNGTISKIGKARASDEVIKSWVEGNTLFVVTQIVKTAAEDPPHNRLEIFEVGRDSALPISTITSTYPILDIAISGTIAYLGTGSNGYYTGGFAAGRLEVWDISKLSNPARLNSVSDNVYAFTTLAIAQNQLIAIHERTQNYGRYGWSSQGILSIYDISNPAYPADTHFSVDYPTENLNAQWFQVVKYGDKWWLKGEYYPTSTVLLSLQNLSFFLIPTFQRFGAALAVIPLDEIAYVLSLDGVISAVPLGTPQNKAISRSPLAYYNAHKLPTCITDARNVDTLIYALTCNGVLEVIDVKQPNKPASVTRLDPALYANLPVFYTLDVSYPYLYLGSDVNLYVFDITNLNQIPLIKTVKFSRNIIALQADKTQVLADIGDPFYNNSYAIQLLLDWQTYITPTFASNLFIDLQQDAEYFDITGKPKRLHNNNIVAVNNNYAAKKGNFLLILQSSNEKIEGVVEKIMLPDGFSAQNLYIMDNVAYVTLSNTDNASQIIQLVDINDKKHLRFLNRVALLPHQALFNIKQSVKWGQYLLQISDSALNFIKINPPNAPEFAGKTASGLGLRGVVAVGDNLMLIGVEDWRIVHPIPNP